MQLRKLRIDALEEHRKQRVIRRCKPRSVAVRLRPSRRCVLAAAAYEPIDIRRAGLANRAQVGHMGLGLAAQPLAYRALRTSYDASERTRPAICIDDCAQTHWKRTRSGCGKFSAQCVPVLHLRCLMNVTNVMYMRRERDRLIILVRFDYKSTKTSS